MVYINKWIYQQSLPVKALYCRKDLGGVSISTTDIRPGVGPFCNGQITWDDGPSPGRTVRRPVGLSVVLIETGATIAGVILLKLSHLGLVFSH